MSLSIMNVYAIRDNKQTMLTVNLASISLGLIHKTLQEMNRMITIGKIILNT